MPFFLTNKNKFTHFADPSGPNSAYKNFDVPKHCVDRELGFLGKFCIGQNPKKHYLCDKNNVIWIVLLREYPEYNNREVITFYYPAQFKMMYEGEPRIFNYLDDGNFNIAYKFEINGKKFVYRIIINTDRLSSYPGKADNPERSARLLNEFNQPSSPEEAAKPHYVTDESQQILCQGVVMPFFEGGEPPIEKSLTALFLFYLKTRRIFVDVCVKGNLIDTPSGIKSPDAGFLFNIMKNMERLMESSQASIECWEIMNEAYDDFYHWKERFYPLLVQLDRALLLIEQLDLYENFTTEVFFDEEESLFYLPKNLTLMKFLSDSYVTLKLKGKIDCRLCDDLMIPPEIKNKMEMYNRFVALLLRDCDISLCEIAQIMRWQIMPASTTKLEALRYFILEKKHPIHTALDLITESDDVLSGVLEKAKERSCSDRTSFFHHDAKRQTTGDSLMTASQSPQ